MNLRLIKAKTFEDKLLVSYGLFGTMPIVEMLGLTAFTWLTPAVVVFAIIKSKGILRLSKAGKFFVVLSCSMILSSIIGYMSSMPGYWKSLGIRNSVWQILFVLLVLCYLNKKHIYKCLFYIKGVYYAAIVHCVWGILQLVIYKVSGIAINKVIFHDLLGVELASFVQMRGGLIALTGLCWNAGNLAPLVIIGYMLSSSIYIKAFFLIITAISGSRTLILGIIVCIVIEILVTLLGRAKDKIKRSYLLIAGSAVALLILVIMTQRDLVDAIFARIQVVGRTFSLEFLQTQDSSRVHARYWTTIPRITQWNSLIHNLFGYGIGCSGYPFAVLLNQYADHAWTVECDFVNILWGTGYVGFALWYLWYCLHIVKGAKIDKKYLILFAGMLVEGVTYNITFNWCYVFLIMLFGLIKENVNIFSMRTSAEPLRWRLSHEVVRGC